MRVIPNSFLQYASEILGETVNGLTGPQIKVFFVAKAAELNVEIPHHSYPFDTPNKRTALLENLLCFENNQRYEIIHELCDFRESEEFETLRNRLVERYSENEIIIGEGDQNKTDEVQVKNSVSSVSNGPIVLPVTPSLPKKRPITERLWFKVVAGILGALLIILTILDIIFGWLGFFD